MSGHPVIFEEFEAQLQSVLHHLYDPALRPPGVVLRVLGLSENERADVLQTALIQAIEDLRPADYVPKTTRSWRLYGILYYRFVSNLAQEEVADRVAITSRHLRREQAAAIHVLALRLWEQASLPAPVEEPESEESLPESPVQEEEAPANPDMQLKNDLMALQESAPGVISDLVQVMKSVLALVERIPAGKNLAIHEASLHGSAPLRANGPLRGALHPSALRQVLWMIIHQAILQPSPGQMALRCGVEGGQAVIELAFTPVFEFPRARQQTIEEILEAQAGALSIEQNHDQLIFRVEMLNVNRTVLVVDDNPDIVHLYQRYLVGTQYHIVHISRGLELLEQLDLLWPDMIVLDIMLPDVDGWDLLTQLSEGPTTRGIPVIICSVVCEPDLALALGAISCLPKPVQRPDFIRALDRALNRV
jgi:CheY-like chemotaxis protein